MSEFQKAMKRGLGDNLWPFTKNVLSEFLVLNVDPPRCDHHCGSTPDDPDLNFGKLTPNFELTEGEYMVVYMKDGLYTYQFGKLEKGICVECPAPDNIEAYSEPTESFAKEAVLAFQAHFMNA